MIEVFKTNVTDPLTAGMLLMEIHKAFEGYTANFDLEDCDHILRVKSTREMIQSSALVSLLNKHGFDAEILPDKPVVGVKKHDLSVASSR